MCLATAYLQNHDENAVLAKNISSIKIDDDIITMTDILGAEYSVKGRLLNADLVNGVVQIAAS